MHPVPIVEQRRCSARAVHQEPVEPSVQSRRKRGVLLGEMNKVGGPVRVQGVAFFLEAARGPRLWELLPRKDEHDISPLVPERHPVGEGSLPRDPSDVHSQRLIAPGPRTVEWLMEKRLDHPSELSFRRGARHPGKKTDDSRHDLP